MIKVSLYFSLFLISFQVLAISSETCAPSKLKQKELHSIFKLIKYPKASLKNREWESRSCYLGDSKHKTRYAEIESSYFEKGVNYQRFYWTVCNDYTKRWKCDKPQDTFRLVDSNKNIRNNDNISTNEV